MVDHPSSVNPLLFLIHSSIHPSTPILLGDGASGPQEPVELPGVVEGVEPPRGPSLQPPTKPAPLIHTAGTLEINKQIKYIN